MISLTIKYLYLPQNNFIQPLWSINHFLLVKTLTHVKSLSRYHACIYETTGLKAPTFPFILKLFGKKKCGGLTKLTYRHSQGPEKAHGGTVGQFRNCTTIYIYIYIRAHPPAGILFHYKCFCCLPWQRLFVVALSPAPSSPTSLLPIESLSVDRHESKRYSFLVSGSINRAACACPVPVINCPC